MIPTCAVCGETDGQHEEEPHRKAEAQSQDPDRRSKIMEFTITIIVQPEQADAFQDLIASDFEGDRIAHVSMTFVNADGETIWWGDAESEVLHGKIADRGVALRVER